MTNPGQRRRVFDREQKAKLERQHIEHTDVPHSEHDEKLESVEGRLEEANEDKGQAPRPVTPAAAERLELPKGAMIAFRKSGGLRFSSHEVIVYPDGRVTYEAADPAKSRMESRVRRQLTDAQIVKMRKMLDQSNFWKMRSPPGKQSPDAFAYEIAARMGSKHNALEVFDGSIPESLQPLLDQMNRLMPQEKE